MFSKLMVCSLFIFCVSCSTDIINSEYDKSYQFSELNSYKWRLDHKELGSDIRLNNELLNNRIVSAVDKDLAAKGYKKQANSESPDFFVSYYLSLDKKINASQISNYGYGYSSGSKPYTTATATSRGSMDVPKLQTVHEYLEGTLIVDIVNPENLHILWRGTFQTEIKELKTTEKKEARVNSAVKKILKAFPPN